MKVITQLIRHFWQRGTLSPQEIEYLLTHGFARLNDVPGYIGATCDIDESEEDTVCETRNERLEPDELEHLEESLVRRAKGRRGEHEPRPVHLKIEELLDRLRGDYQRRETDLKSVVSLAQRISPVDTWQEAVAELRSTTPERFYQELCAGLKEASVLLGDVWQASESEPFHQLIREEEIRGSVVRAFQMLLVSSGPNELGRYAWILKHDEAQTLINLRAVHERLLNSLSRMYKEQRLLLTHSLAKSMDDVQVWALVLLYNAYRDPALGDRPDYGVEYGPLEPPDERVWRNAWTSAMQMDRQAVSKFLIACYNEDESANTVDDDQCHRPLMCPVGWHVPDPTSPQN